MTAYEMRISDCSSDVCSSDLRKLINGAFEAPFMRLRPKHVDQPAASFSEFPRVERRSPFQIIAVAIAEAMQPHIMNGQCAFRARLGDVGMGDARAVDDIDGARSVHPEAAAFQDD